MTINQFQRQIEAIFFEKDCARGLEADFRWFVEEVGELARAIRYDNKAKLAEEFADVFAWLNTMASICGVELEQAIEKYASGCPKCKQTPCVCR